MERQLKVKHLLFAILGGISLMLFITAWGKVYVDTNDGILKNALLDSLKVSNKQMIEFIDTKNKVLNIKSDSMIVLQNESNKLLKKLTNE